MLPTKEEDIEAFRKKNADGGILGNILKEISEAVRDMHSTMKQLAVVQFFTWFALPFMWQFYGLTVAHHVFGAADESSAAFKSGTEWGGVCFAVYNFICFLVAFGIPPLANKIGRKGVHITCLILGGVGLVSTYFATGPYFLWIGMAGVGIAWASILSMPYVILAGAIKPDRMGVYMGVFNLFIVIPQVVQSFLTPQIEPPSHRPIGPGQEKILTILMERIGVVRHPRRDAGSWLITGEAIASGDGWQDWPATHRVDQHDRARIRFQVLAPSATQAERAAVLRIATNEFGTMSRLQHDGLLRPRDLVESDLGVGLVYPDDPAWQRLDLWLSAQTNGIPLATQPSIIRQLGEALQYAHNNRVVHRALTPRAVRVRALGAGHPAS